MWHPDGLKQLRIDYTPAFIRQRWRSLSPSPVAEHDWPMTA